MSAPLKSYIDRILNVLAEIDNLGGDKKEIYKELAGDGYDRTVVSQVVGHIRKKAAKPGKFAEQSALFDLYLTEYEGVGTRVATHAAREAEIEAALGITEILRHGVNGPTPEHDADGVIIEPEAAMLPQTAGSETAVANSTPGSGAGTVDAGEANWPSEMTTASPANEPETIPPVADPATVVSEAANGDSAPSLAAIPVADRSQPNPICRDPDDCGVYASWAMPCQVCKAAAAHRSAA